MSAIEDDRDFREVPHDDRWVLERHREIVADVRNYAQELMCAAEEIGRKMAKAGLLDCEVRRSVYSPVKGYHVMVHDHYLTNEQAAARFASIIKETLLDNLSDDAQFSMREIG